MPKNVLSLRLDEDVVARIDAVRDGSRTRFIEEAIMTALAEREGAVVAQGDEGTRTSPMDQAHGVVPFTPRTLHRPTCHCAMCKPPKNAA